MTLLLGMVLLLLACLWTAWMRMQAIRLRRRVSAEVKAELAKTGFVVSGGIFGRSELRGSMHGVEIVVENEKDVQAFLTFGEGMTSACMVSASAKLLDQIVLKAGQTDRIMGPLPTAHRLRTGYPPFDARYAVFLGLPREAPSVGYRQAGETQALPWAQAPILATLIDFNLLWIRVKGGQIEIAFYPIEPEDMPLVAIFAAAFVRASESKPFVLPTRAPRSTIWPSQAPGVGLASLWFWVGGLALPLGLFLGRLPPLRTLDDSFICGEGDKMIVEYSDDITCAEHPDTSTLLHDVGSVIFCFSLFVLLGLSYSTLRLWRSRGASPGA